jgi:short-subunit dehydrogenase
MESLHGKNCLITGAASGIGRALAQGLAREGMNLFLADIDTDGLSEVREELERGGVTVHTARCDVSRYEDFVNLAEEFRSSLGDVDLLINNAGIASAGLVEEIAAEEWERTLSVNAWSVIHSIRAFLPRMIERGTGHIVNVASGAGIVGIPYHAPYIASKFAVVGISEALYSELKHVCRGIDISVICPTFLKTNIIKRTPIAVPRRLLEEAGGEDVAARMEEFKAIFWEKYTRGAPPVAKVAEKYIRGIKKKRFYIFDTPRLRVAMVLKGACEPLYKAVLRSEGRKDLRMIEETLEEMGIRVA